MAKRLFIKSGQGTSDDNYLARMEGRHSSRVHAQGPNACRLVGTQKPICVVDKNHSVVGNGG